MKKKLNQIIIFTSKIKIEKSFSPFHFRKRRHRRMDALIASYGSSCSDSDSDSDPLPPASTSNAQPTRTPLPPPPLALLDPPNCLGN